MYTSFNITHTYILDLYTYVYVYIHVTNDFYPLCKGRKTTLSPFLSLSVERSHQYLVAFASGHRVRSHTRDVGGKLWGKSSAFPYIHTHIYTYIHTHMYMIYTQKYSYTHLDLDLFFCVLRQNFYCKWAESRLIPRVKMEVS